MTNRTMTILMAAYAIVIVSFTVPFIVWLTLT